MKKTITLFWGIILASVVFSSCENNQPHVTPEPPAFYAVASGVVVDENGEPISNVECLHSYDQIIYSNYDDYRKDYPNGSKLFTDENGKFEFHLFSCWNSTEYSETPITDSLFLCFFHEADSVSVGYEPLCTEDPISVEFVWNGIEYDYKTTNNLFEPIDLGKFVMHEKK